MRIIKVQLRIDEVDYELDVIDEQIGGLYGSYFCLPCWCDENAVGWDDYGRVRNRDLTDLNDAIFEMSHMIATLTPVDGAVVITKRFEILGFGAEIAGTLPEVQHVAHALDLEGATYNIQRTDDVGTRHRSVYRLCNAIRDVLGIVVSHDGSASF